MHCKFIELSPSRDLNVTGATSATKDIKHGCFQEYHRAPDLDYYIYLNYITYTHVCFVTLSYSKLFLIDMCANIFL